MSRVAGGWIPSRVAAVKAVDGARSADPEHSWRQDLEDLSEEYVVQQANSANTVAVPLDKQQTVDLEADEWGSIWQALKVQYQPVWAQGNGRSRMLAPLLLRKLVLGGSVVATVFCSCSSRFFWWPNLLADGFRRLVLCWWS